MKKIFLLISLIFLIFLAALLIFSFYPKKNPIEELAPNFALSKSELDHVGIFVEHEPTTEYFKKSFFAPSTDKGHLVVYYGDPSPFFYTIYFHTTKPAALEHYQQQLDFFSEASDRVISQRDYGNQFTLYGIKNQLGKENYILWYNHENKVLLITLPNNPTLLNQSKSLDSLITDLGNTITAKINATIFSSR